MPSNRTIIDTINTVIERQRDKRPVSALVHAVDGRHVDIRLENSSSVVRHVDVVGDADSVDVGDTVRLVWENDGRPVVLLSGAGNGAGGGGGSVVPDNVTIEDSVAGLRVKQGGISREHLGFSLSDEVSRLNPLTAGGWTILQDGQIINAGIRIDPDGEISLGTGNNVIKMSSMGIQDVPGTQVDESEYRLWVGHVNPQSAAFSVTSSGVMRAINAVISGSVGSANYLPGVQGWHANSSGWAEFQDVLVRGRLRGVVVEEVSTSAVGGRLRVSDSSTFIADVEPSDTTIDVSSSVFSSNDILQSQPSISRNEWMRVEDDGTVISGGIRYTVTRNIHGGGAVAFLAGETVVRLGHATFPDEAFLFGDPDVGFGDSLASFGGGSYVALGGFLTLEGSSDYGPYFGVARRFGAAYNQISDVVRVGLLQDFLNYPLAEYGFAAGDISSYMMYNRRDGLIIVTDSGNTSIDNSGVSTSNLGLVSVATAPPYIDGQLVFYVDSTAKQLRGRYKDAAYESDTLIASL
jgi:hypothetical protein